MAKTQRRAGSGEAPAVAGGAAMIGTVVSVNTSPRKTVRKTPVGACLVLEGHGLDGDAHGGDWHRQVSLLALESIETMRAKGLQVGPGDFAENITTEGIDLLALPVGSRVEIGDELVLEISQIGKECHTKCAIYYQAGDCVMPREGIFAVVRSGGNVSVGDEVRAYPTAGAGAAGAGAGAAG